MSFLRDIILCSVSVICWYQIYFLNHYTNEVILLISDLVGENNDTHLTTIHLFLLYQLILTVVKNTCT